MANSLIFNFQPQSISVASVHRTQCNHFSLQTKIHLLHHTTFKNPQIRRDKKHVNCLFYISLRLLATATTGVLVSASAAISFAQLAVANDDQEDDEETQNSRRKQNNYAQSEVLLLHTLPLVLDLKSAQGRVSGVHMRHLCTNCAKWNQIKRVLIMCHFAYIGQSVALE